MSSEAKRRAAVGAGVGLAVGYAYTRTKFHQNTSDGFRVDDPPAPGSPEFARVLEGLTGAPVRHGNRVRILRNGCRTFPAMLEAIGSAQETVDFSSYIYWPGAITNRFTEAFVDRAREGVEVNVVLDGYGSAKLDRDHVRRLEAGGVNVRFFRPPHWYALHKLNNRMHRRLLVVDGTVGFAGGVGIADVWSGDADDPEHWRETHARIEGPAVRDLLSGFHENWVETTGNVLGPRHVPCLAALDQGVDLQVVTSSPTSGPNKARALFHLAIAGARTRLWLTTAYFTAGRALMGALCEAAQRGVDVRILANGRHVDKEVARVTAQHSYGALLESGVRVFEYDRTMLHAKTLVVDDAWGNVGSGNFDHRSFELDLELNVNVIDRAVVDELARHFLEDLEVSVELDLERWRARPLARRALEHVGEVARQSF